MTQTKAELLQTRHQGDIRLGDADSTHYVGFKAPATVGTSLVWTLPAADGTANYLLKTDGSGNLGWVADSSTDSTKMPLAGGTFTGDVTFSGDNYNLVWDKSDNALEFADSAKAVFGQPGNDLTIRHDGSNSYIHHDGAGALVVKATGTGEDVYIQATNDVYIQPQTSEEGIKVIGNGAVELYHDNSKTVYTTTLGVEVKGGDTSSKTQLSIWGNEGQRGVLQISADDGDDNADHWQFQARTDGNLNIQNLNSGSWGNSAVFVGGGAAMFYNNNVKALETVNNGIKVSGAESGDALLYLSADEGDDNADQWRVKADTSGNFGIDNYSTGSWVNGLTIDGSNHATVSNNVLLNRDSYIKIGAGADLQLTHNGTHSYINNSTGTLYIRGSEVIVAGNTTGETIAQFVENGAAIIRYDNVVKFETTSAGTKFTGGMAQVATAAAALELDLNTSNYFTKTISGNSTFTFANPAASGQVTAFTLELTHSSGTVTWPSSVKWNADTAPTLTTGKTHLFMFVTDDGGSRYRGSALVDYVN